MFKLATATSFLMLAARVAAHGKLSSPAPRSATVGDAFGSACGTQMLSQVTSDPYGNIQGEMQVAASDFDASACNVWQCKGYQFADNQANVQSYTAGEIIPMVVEIRAPHTGTANVSIVSTASNTVIGEPLISWDSYASTSTGVTADQTNFDITIPEDIGDQCATAGDCVIQWWWDAREIDQTYEDCIDFTVGASGSSASSSAPAVTSAAATSATESSSAVTSAVETSAAATSAATSAAETSAAATSVAATSVVETSAAASTSVAVSSAPASSAAATSEAASSTAAATSAAATSVAASSAASSAAAPTSTGSTGTNDANVCMNTYNKCIAASQPSPDWTGCSATRDSCLSTATYSRRMRRASYRVRN
ncbi:chitin binding domain-containing protein [Schizophyllum amplum]|uniref:Chitin binding domain-containing protein n=1 Tax=Schizophyllum amplum TaxID=97359 RepID=A0A550CSP8_9AGAR|nr:chitin binding domain-containing protein [Auriculariopsis ampla]